MLRYKNDYKQSDTYLQTSQRHAPKKSNAAVRDDWEDDDEEEELPSDERNRQIWEEAYVSKYLNRAIVLTLFVLRNTKVPAPMPVFSPSSSSVVPPPPPAAFQPALKILKRPTNTTMQAGNRTPSPASSESLKDREARYQEARNRIFGDVSSGDSETKRPTPAGVARNPYGPTTSSDTPMHTVEPEGPVGFGKRLTHAPPQAPHK